MQILHIFAPRISFLRINIFKPHGRENVTKKKQPYNYRHYDEEIFSGHDGIGD